MKQELPTLLEHLSKPPVLVGSCISIVTFVCCFVDRCLFFFFCVLSFDLRILISLWYLKILLMRPHTRWCLHEGKHIVAYAHYYNTTYTTTYSVVSCGRLYNAFSLTSNIVLLFMILIYSFTLYSSIIIDIPTLSER